MLDIITCVIIIQCMVASPVEISIGFRVVSDPLEMSQLVFPQAGK